MREKPAELDRAFISSFDQTDFFWTRELLVTRRPLHRVPERPRRKRREFHRIIALDALFGSQLEANSSIVARFRNSPMKCKKLLGAHQYPVQLEQPYRQTCSPQDGIWRKAKFLKLSGQRARNSESVAHRLADSIILLAMSLAALLLLILLVADVLHPIDDLAIFLLLNGDVC